MLNLSRHLRPLLGCAAVAACTVAATAAGTTAASAASVATPNACLYSWDNYYRDLDITLTGSSTPNPLAPGETTTLTASLSGEMPAWLPTYGYNFDLLTVGENRIPTTLVVAIEGVGSVEQVQVVQVHFDAVTTVSDPDGVPRTNDEGGTPPIVDVQLDPTTWTSTGGPIELRQASGGVLTTLPDLGPDGGAVTPEGSIYISTSLSADLHFNLDCQPGEQVAADRGETYTPGQAQPFETVALGTAAPVETTTTTVAESTTTTTGDDAPVLAAPAEDEDSGGGSNVALIVAPIALLVVLVALGVRPWSRGKKDAATPADGSSPADPDGPPPAPPVD